MAKEVKRICDHCGEAEADVDLSEALSYCGLCYESVSNFARIQVLEASLAEETAKNEGLRADLRAMTNKAEMLETMQKHSTPNGIVAERERRLLARLARAEAVVVAAGKGVSCCLYSIENNGWPDHADKVLTELEAALLAWDAGEGGAGDERGKET